MSPDFLSLFNVPSLLIGGLAGALLALIIVLPFWIKAAMKASSLDDRFKTLAIEALQLSADQFLNLAQQKLQLTQNDSAHDLGRRQQAIASLVEPIGKSLEAMNQKIQGLGLTSAGLEAQLRHFAEDQTKLRKETSALVQALKNPAARGRWGEIQLERTLEIVGMIEGTHFRSQVSAASETSRVQPDFIIDMPGNLKVIIDVKTPLDPYWETLDDQGDVDTQALDKFRTNVRSHLKTLSSREYWRYFDSPEFVVMFLPTEGLYAMAITQDRMLIEDAAKAGVILASPTTILGLLRVIMAGWHKERLSLEARTISDMASDLYRRMASFGDHMGKLGRALSSSVGAYNDAVGGLEKSVLPQARRFKELSVSTGGKDIADLSKLEDQPRTLAAPEFTEDKSVIPLRGER